MSSVGLDQFLYKTTTRGIGRTRDRAMYQNKRDKGLLTGAITAIAILALGGCGALVGLSVVGSGLFYVGVALSGSTLVVAVVSYTLIGLHYKKTKNHLWNEAIRLATDLRQRKGAAIKKLDEEDFNVLLEQLNEQPDHEVGNLIKDVIRGFSKEEFLKLLMQFNSQPDHAVVSLLASFPDKIAARYLDAQWAGEEFFAEVSDDVMGALLEKMHDPRRGQKHSVLMAQFYVLRDLANRAKAGPDDFRFDLAAKAPKVYAEIVLCGFAGDQFFREYLDRLVEALDKKGMKAFYEVIKSYETGHTVTDKGGGVEASKPWLPQFLQDLRNKLTEETFSLFCQINEIQLDKEL